MGNSNLYIIILIVAIFTIIFRILPIFIKIPENNKYINTFFDILPISILSVLAIPEVFVSLGNNYIDIIISILGVIFVAYLTYTKKSLAFIAMTSIFFIGTLRGLSFGSF
ncbi:AzlD domain-containing protein [Oceanivirga salmonicida]|uniref:AzlD domain-containing protein n=1 Tax=Oceanivirga salmonicida TaxID=1769291 RepID=UPI000835F751|nr:AzlD domain-containing protein [Oceanivirga salmonicida]